MELVFHSSPEVNFASNTFINVPTIFQFEDTPLVSVVKEQNVGFTTDIPIYHEDGTYLAKVSGNRVFPTDDGQKAGLEVQKRANLWICTVDGRTAFEIRHGQGDAFRITAELYTPEGYFVKVADSLSLFAKVGTALQIRGIVMSDNVFQGMDIGILLRKDGSIAMGVSRGARPPRQ